MRHLRRARNVARAARCEHRTLCSHPAHSQAPRTALTVLHVTGCCEAACLTHPAGLGLVVAGRGSVRLWPPLRPAACSLGLAGCGMPDHPTALHVSRPGHWWPPGPPPPQVYVPPHPLVKHWLAIMRNAATPSPMFHGAAAELGRILIYEAVRDFLPTVDLTVPTPLGVEADATVVDPGRPIKASGGGRGRGSEGGCSCCVAWHGVAAGACSAWQWRWLAPGLGRWASSAARLAPPEAVRGRGHRVMPSLRDPAMANGRRTCPVPRAAECHAHISTRPPLATVVRTRVAP